MTSPLLSRFAPRAGLVTLRQTFVRRSHGTSGHKRWPEAVFTYAATREAAMTAFAKSWHRTP